MSNESSITRRQAVRAAGAAGAAYLIAPSLASSLGEGTAIAASKCTKLTPELTEGPYWVNTSHSGATIAGYTTQIFFSDTDNSRVLTGAAPYNTRSPQKDPTTDENDTVLTSSDDRTNIIAVKGSIKHGYAATFNIMLDNGEVDATGSLSRPNTGGGPGGTPPPAA